ncbi:hypothetical protein [Xanthomonas graminis]|uniref:hypothetical protein n=1 Tax=Xanthomonas graminis TaxID=3390026 RepID=UPI001112D522|nr:hypothetical protein [Xanthomonas translucens]
MLITIPEIASPVPRALLLLILPPLLILLLLALLLLPFALQGSPLRVGEQPGKNPAGATRRMRVVFRWHMDVPSKNPRLLADPARSAGRPDWGGLSFAYFSLAVQRTSKSRKARKPLLFLLLLLYRQTTYSSRKEQIKAPPPDKTPTP